MEQRENALREALQKNEEEIQRWENYSKEQEIAIENLDMFSKKLSVEVMVPFGNKAFMPGRLIHTNEVLVGHFQDYYTKCSAHTAIEICKKRLEKVKEQLDKLESEKVFFENKLEKPYLDGVLPNTEEREIIEEYDEEKEKIWRDIHKQKLKDAKLKERQERERLEAEDKPIEEIIQKLEEQDMMDELNEELNGVDVEANCDTQDILSKLMSGEINLPPPKKRLAHNRADTLENPTKTEVKENIVNKTTISEHEQIEKPTENSFNAENSDDDSDTNTPQEVRLIQEQAEYLSTSERAGFFHYEMQIIDGKIASIRPNDDEALKEKTRLLNIRYYLEELIELHEEVPETDSDVTELDKEVDVKEEKPERQQERRISFALEDQMLEFRKNETVAQMIPAKSHNEDKPKRDIIRLDEPILSTEAAHSNDMQKRKTIAEKVEENLKTQSLSDADLVNKILDSSMPHPHHTLHIRFKHSAHSPESICDSKNGVPQSPADLYDLHYGSHSDQTEEETANIKFREKSRENAFVDVRSEFLTPRNGEPVPSETQSKPILKNKSAVEFERRTEDNKEKSAKQKKNVKKSKAESDYLSAYNKVMGEVFENNSVQPDPLPKEKFIDMHAPKKRISRFKQMRSEAQ